MGLVCACTVSPIGQNMCFLKTGGLNLVTCSLILKYLDLAVIAVVSQKIFHCAYVCVENLTGS